MNRREFFKGLAIATGAAVIAPKLLISNAILVNPHGKVVSYTQSGSFRVEPKNYIQITRAEESLFKFLSTTRNNITTHE